jgi:hypothetical protein
MQNEGRGAEKQAARLLFRPVGGDDSRRAAQTNHQFSRAEKQE